MAVRLIHGSLAVPRQWEDAAGLALTITTWASTAPELLPTLADDHEPVRRTFDPEHFTDSLDAWSTRHWIAIRRDPPLVANFLGSYGFTNSTAHITIRSTPERERNLDSLERLVRALAKAWSPDYGFVHQICDPEIPEAQGRRRPDVIVTNRRTGEVDMSAGFSKALEHGLPTVYWLNIFGPRYETVIGTDRLIKAPWASIERREYGLVAKVTEEPPDDESYDDFRTRRDRIMVELGLDLFFPNATRVPDLSLRTIA